MLISCLSGQAQDTTARYSSMPVKAMGTIAKTPISDSLHKVEGVKMVHATDTLPFRTTRTAAQKREDGKLDTLRLSPNAISNIIHYKATDSVAISLDSRKAYLYRDGSIEYQGMVLTADDIEVDFNHQTMRARGTVDSAKADSSATQSSKTKYIGRPYFKQEDAEYNADTIVFNYNTEKGIISGVITQEGDGYLHGTKVKKINDTVMYLSSGMYTTCNYAHPHYALNFSNSKLITGDKIVTGPVYLSIEDAPTPLALPFAFFPMTHGRSSGILIPSYGWANGRGYYLRDGGYYLALGDYLDLSLIGEIYTNLSWSAQAKSNYYRRYHYKGNFDIRYSVTKEGIEGDPNTYNAYNDFKVAWRHEQDAKANPYSRFSADVNLQSRNYNRNTSSSSDYFNSTTTSSISYTTTIGGFLNVAASARESYNVQTGLMNIKLPSISANTKTIYPLRRKNPTGGYKWYENISMSYVFNTENNLSGNDSVIFQPSTLSRMQYGIQHKIPIQSTVKVLRFFNWTNSFNYNERWHWSTIEKNYDTANAQTIIDTIHGFRANRDFGFSSSISTRLYGMFNFKYGPIRALRHVVNPSLSFNFNPDFGADRFGYWRQYTDNDGYVHRYSIFEQSLYGGPSDGRSGRVAFSLGNNLEMKVRSLRDTTADLKKVTLIENLNFNMSYDIAKDSLNLSDLTVTGRTTLFKNLVLNYSGSFVPYVVDTLGRKHNQLLWDAKGRLFQRSNSTWSAQLSYSLNERTFKKEDADDSHKPTTPDILQTPINDNPLTLIGSYADFSVPWNLSFNYTLSYVSTYVAAKYNFKSEVVQTLGFSGNFSLTDKWKFTFSSGYDFVNHGLSYTSLDIYRDLHCWEMHFNWIPFGYYRSWNFQINIKAESLKDIKYKKEQRYQDNQGYYSY
ncbi:MAG: hypothetical protein K6E93_08500 [Bacteroidales bacterium]|nr:hypothetical protein [Bacteroidales bacterium]